MCINITNYVILNLLVEIQKKEIHTSNGSAVWLCPKSAARTTKQQEQQLCIYNTEERP